MAVLTDSPDTADGIHCRLHCHSPTLLALYFSRRAVCSKTKEKGKHTSHQDKHPTAPVGRLSEVHVEL